jgi:hypothetical protein
VIDLRRELDLENQLDNKQRNVLHVGKHGARWNVLGFGNGTVPGGALFCNLCLLRQNRVLRTSRAFPPTPESLIPPYVFFLDFTGKFSTTPDDSRRVNFCLAINRQVSITPHHTPFPRTHLSKGQTLHSRPLSRIRLNQNELHMTRDSSKRYGKSHNGLFCGSLHAALRAFLYFQGVCNLLSSESLKAPRETDAFGAVFYQNINNILR